MSKSQTITRHTTVHAPVSEADDVVLALARLLGRQAAREMAALISLGIGPNDKHPLADAEGVQVTLVAGAGFEPATFRL